MKVVVAAMLGIVACGPGNAQFGAVTDDGVSAVKEFCGSDFEYQSVLRGVPQDQSHFAEIRGAKKLLVLHCHANASLSNWIDISIEADTKQLLMASIIAPSARFDALVDRAVVPALDDDLRSRLTALRSWLRAQPRIPTAELHNRYVGRGVFIAVDVRPYEGGAWELDIGHKAAEAAESSP